MCTKKLVALAKAISGKTQQKMAFEMGHPSHTRLTSIVKGRTQADASEIVYLATLAEKDPIEVLSKVESERHPKLAAFWAALIKKRTP